MIPDQLSLDQTHKISIVFRPIYNLIPRRTLLLSDKTRRDYLSWAKHKYMHTNSQ